MPHHDDAEKNYMHDNFLGSLSEQLQVHYEEAIKQKCHYYMGIMKAVYDTLTACSP